jgi:copper(I)-binding protein
MRGGIRKVTYGCFVLVCVFLGASLGACSAAPALHVESAQIRDLLPGRDTTAAYFTLSNNTAESITLIGAESSAAQAIEMHRSVVRGDSVRMQRVKRQTIAAGEQVDFEPGGLHLMVFGVAAIGESTLITLQFASGEQLTVSFSKLPN